MENLLEVVEQFLSLSDEKLEELAAKNHWGFQSFFIVESIIRLS